MKKEHEAIDLLDYIRGLKRIRSRVLHIIDNGEERMMKQAAISYSLKLNQLLIQRNIKHIDVLFPFFDLPVMEKHKKELDLVRINSEGEHLKILQNIVHRINKELEGIMPAG